MGDMSIFSHGAKVVFSPDKMRAWVSLTPPQSGAAYTVQAIAEWLPTQGVVYGADDGMINAAISSEKYDTLLEVARGKEPVDAQGADFTLKVSNVPFSGLKSTGDGALIYDDLYFLNEANEGDILAEIIPAIPSQEGIAVTGESIHPRHTEASDKELHGSGFVVSSDGKHYLAPCLSHISFVNEQLILTPLKKIDSLTPEDGEISFKGNVLVDGDIAPHSQLSASGSIYVTGRAMSATIKAGNNLLLCKGMQDGGTFGSVEAKGHVWGLRFESCHIKAEGNIHANYLMGCEARCNGMASIIGGRALIDSTNLYAKGGVITGTIGGVGNSAVSAGLEREFFQRYDTIGKKIDRLNIDIQSAQQNLTTHERIHKGKADKGKNDPSYKDMLLKRNQSLSVLNILTAERTRMKRVLGQASSVVIIVRTAAAPGTTITIDTHSMQIVSTMKKTRFRCKDDLISATAIAN